MIFINRNCQKPVDSCFYYCLSDVSVKNTEASPSRVPKNYPKLTGRCRLEAPTRANFRHLLRAVPAHNALFQFLQAFSRSRNLELACCLGWVSSLNLFFFLLILHACPVFLKYALPTQAFSGERCKVFKNTYFVEQLKTAVSKKIISYICSFN